MPIVTEDRLKIIVFNTLIILAIIQTCNGTNIVFLNNESIIKGVICCSLITDTCFHSCTCFSVT